jgi:hypothetical protein
VKYTVDCCTTLERWTKVGDETAQAIKKALGRGAKYRTVLDNGENIHFTKQMSALVLDKNFQVRLAKKPLEINVAIFDSKEASLNFYPSKGLSESPMIWTNHPSLLVSFQTQFEKDWASSEQIIDQT